MATEKIFLAYASAVQSLVKIIFGLGCLLVKSQFELEIDSVRSESRNFVLVFCLFSIIDFSADSQSFDALILIGIVGFFLSLRLVVGLREDSKRKNHTWVCFQWLSMFYLIAFCFCFFGISDHDRFQTFVLLYCLVDFFTIFAILSIFSSINVQHESPDSVELSSVMIKDDLPPTYDECIKKSEQNTLQV
jgi:hypothetical protein